MLSTRLLLLVLHCTWVLLATTQWVPVQARYNTASVLQTPENAPVYAQAQDLPPPAAVVFSDLSYAENMLAFDLLQTKLTSLPVMDAASIQYGTVYGSPRARGALARYFQRSMGATAVSEDTLVVTPGTNSALANLLRCFAPNPTDTVLVLGPHYSAYTALQELGGVPGKLVSVLHAQAIATDSALTSVVSPWQDAHAHDAAAAAGQPQTHLAEAMEIDFLALEQALEQETNVKALLFSTPSNPQGRRFSRTALKKLIQFAVQHDLQIVSDEIFAECDLTGEGTKEGAVHPHVSALAVAFDLGQEDRVHVASGLAKVGLGGIKIGVAISQSTDVLISLRRQAYYATASTSALHVTQHLLEDDSFVDVWLQRVQTALPERYLLVANTLYEQGIPFQKAHAGLSLLIDLRAACDSFDCEQQLYEDMLTFAAIKLNTGHSTRAREPGWFRLCFAAHQDAAIVVDGIKRLGRFLRVKHPEVVAPSYRERFLSSWKHTDFIFHTLLRQDALYKRPILLRHPFIFYLGHLPAFAWNQIRPTVGEAPVHARFDELFARGVDPDVMTGTCEHSHSADLDTIEWPELTLVQDYVYTVRQRILDSIPDVLAAGAQEVMADHGRVLELALEHEAMHQETLLYMYQQLAAEYKCDFHALPVHIQADVLALPARNAASGNPISAGSAAYVLVRAPETPVVLGADFESTVFGWDNEFPRVLGESVGDLRVLQHPVTNAQYLEFVRAGGYSDRTLWASDGDWLWKNSHNIESPSNWKRPAAAAAMPVPVPVEAEENWQYQTLFNTIPLSSASNLPVFVSQAEATAYCTWQGARLPTESEWKHFQSGRISSTAKFTVAAPTGNYAYRSWTVLPVGSFPAGASASGVQDLAGNGWEWTSTPFHGFQGFKAYMPEYPGYSADFFDQKHFIMLGGSYVSDELFLRDSFRNWYQARYAYVFGQFRCVKDLVASSNSESVTAAAAATAAATAGTGTAESAANEGVEVLYMGDNGVQLTLSHVGTGNPASSTAGSEVDGFAHDVLVGLSAPQGEKFLHSTYFYDNTGSEIYEKITQLPEYYLTNAEKSILVDHKQRIAELFSATATHEEAKCGSSGQQQQQQPSSCGEEQTTRPFNLVELGAGDGHKTAVLMQHFATEQVNFRYTSVDISEGALRSQASLLLRNHDLIERVNMSLIVGDNIEVLRSLSSNQAERTVVAFFGSSIGNYDDTEIASFLGSLWSALNHNDVVLVGFDLRKTASVLSAAYNDSSGVTADFNLNLLSRMNIELGANFSLNLFDFHSLYDPLDGAIHSFLISNEDQHVYVPPLKRSFEFKQWEPVHTEVSRKFTLEQVSKYAKRSGFRVVENLFDQEKRFVDSVWVVEKQ